MFQEHPATTVPLKLVKMKFTATLVSITFVLLKVVSGIPTPNIDEHAMKTKGKQCIVESIHHLTQIVLASA